MLCKLSVKEVREALDFQARKAMQKAAVHSHVEEKENKSATTTRVFATAEIALKLAEETAHQCEISDGHLFHSLQKQCRIPSIKSKTLSSINTSIPVPASVVTDSHDWEQAYNEWHVKTFELEKGKSKKIPNPKQKQVLDVLHAACVKEESEKHAEEKSQVSVPLRQLIHGLPGSGKSKLLIWIRSYFEDVWRWTYGEQFCFLAPLNSMANNIGGNTVHSWGGIPFKDRRGVNIAPKSADSEETPAMTIKCGKLRFLFIDEIEATGADTIGTLEANVCQHVSSHSPYKYARFSNELGHESKKSLPRCFGGVHVFFLGDFWQLNPTGQIAIMSNPYGEKVLSSAKASFIMRMFWIKEGDDSLLPWEDGKRILHLTRNERSGADKWFSHVAVSY